MKKQYLFLFVTIIILSACSRETSDVITTNTVEDNIQNESVVGELIDETGNELAEKLIADFLNKIYTIDNPKDYERELEMRIEDALEGKENHLGYDEFCSEKGLSSVLGNRMHGMYREVALAKNFRMSLNDLEYNVSYMKDADGSILNQYKTIVYDYSASLLLEYEDGSTEIIKEEGSINVKYIDNEWKVEVFKLKVFNNLWTDNIINNN